MPPQPELLSFFTTWFPLRRLHFSMPTIADPAFTPEAAPSNTISQHSYSMNKHNNKLPLQRSSRSRGHRDCDFTAPPYSRGSTSIADCGETAPNNQHRQRQTSVTESIAEPLEGSDPRGTSVPSIEIVSNREASSQAWVQRQRIDTREGKTSTMNTDTGRFTAEYGKPVGVLQAGVTAKGNVSRPPAVPSAVRKANLEGGFGDMAEGTEFTHLRYTAA